MPTKPKYKRVEIPTKTNFPEKNRFSILAAEEENTAPELPQYYLVDQGNRKQRRIPDRGKYS